MTINEFAENSYSIFIYPNPSPGIFTVDLHHCGDTKISVYDVLGKCLWNKTYSDGVDPRIDLSNQTKGVYFLCVTSERQSTVRKLVLN